MVLRCDSEQESFLSLVMVAEVMVAEALLSATAFQIKPT